MATATRGTGLDAARMEELRQQFQREQQEAKREQQEAAYLEKLKKEQAMAEKGGLGRLAQGVRNVGGKFAPALGAAKAAAPMMQGAAAGAGFAAGQAGVQAAKGLIAKPLSLLRNIIPENVMGWYVLLIMIVYWYSWMAGFAAPLVLTSHAILALIGFFLFVYVENSLEEGKGSLWQVIRRNGVTFSILLIIDYMLLTGQVQWNLVFIAALLLAFREGNPLEDLKRVVMVMLVASVASAVAPFIYSRFNSLFFSAAAKIALPLNFEVWSLNFGYLPFIIALLLNRTFTYPFFWFAIFGLSKKTRVARSLAWIIMFLFIFASWPSIAPEVNKLHSQYITGATAEQKAFWPNIFKQAGANARGAVTSLFQSFTVKTASAYEKAEQVFGFGEPEKAPPVGLVIKEDRTMPAEFDISTGKTPNPGVVIAVENPFPSDVEQRFIEVIGIECRAARDGAILEGKGKSDTGFAPAEGEGKALEVYHTGGGTGVVCEFKGKDGKNALTEGDYKMDVKVKYRVKTSAYLTNTFMKADLLRELRKDSKVNIFEVKDVRPPDGQYKNFPVSLTWYPASLVESPSAIDISTDSPQNSAMGVFVAKSPGWSEGEIYGVKSLKVTLPEGASLVVDNNCDFTKAGTAGNTYEVKAARIMKFVGKNARFDCGMRIPKDVLSGGELAHLRFDASGEFIFVTEKKGVSFTVKGEGTSSAPAPSGAAPKAPTTTPAGGGTAPLVPLAPTTAPVGSGTQV